MKKKMKTTRKPILEKRNSNFVFQGKKNKITLIKGPNSLKNTR